MLFAAKCSIAPPAVKDDNWKGLTQRRRDAEKAAPSSASSMRFPLQCRERDSNPHGLAPERFRLQPAPIYGRSAQGFGRRFGVGSLVAPAVRRGERMAVGTEELQVLPAMIVVHPID